MNAGGDARRVVKLLGLLVLLLLPACQGGIRSMIMLPPDPDDAPPPVEEVLPVEPPPPVVVAPPDARVEPGAYQDDPRVRTLIDAWPSTTTRASQSLADRTGLVFPDAVVPQIVLKPFGDESRARALSSDVQGGRRVPVIEINLERIAAGRESTDDLLRVALAEAIYEETGRRLGSVPDWVVEAARVAARGRIERSLVELKDEATQGGEQEVQRRGIGALLLLADAREAAHIQRFFRFTSEGDDPDAYLARLARDPGGAWEGRARQLLEWRLASIDATPAETLRDARQAYDELGRAALEASLPQPVAPRIQAEVQTLRARAAADEGDHAEVRRLLRALPEGAWASLDDPGSAMALWIRAESRPEGDAARAARLGDRFARDYPRAAAAQGRQRRPDEALGVLEAAKRIQALLDDHSAGAARRLLEGLGERAGAPELSALRLEVARAEETPSTEALEANRRRVHAWLARPGPQTEKAARDGGAASATALARALERGQVRDRKQGVRLLAQAADAGRAVHLLGDSWRGHPRRLRHDLEVLLESVPYPALRLWVEGTRPDALAGIDPEKLWSALRFGLSPVFLEVDPTVISELRSREFAARRDALQRVIASEQATPEVVAHALADSAMLMRREAARVAARLGYGSLLGVALRDEAWAVRQAGVAGIVDVYGTDALRRLLEFAARDPAPEVRMAALVELQSAPGSRAQVADASVRAFQDPHGGVRRTAEMALGGMTPADALPAIHRGLLAERSRPEAKPASYARLFVLFQRLAGWDPGYYPGMPEAELDALIRKAGEVSRRVTSAAAGNSR